jgi:lambda repressor-like predicted transcriptional regulator
MNTRIPLDKSDWIDKLESICARRILSLGELSKEIGIHYNTLKCFMDRDNETITKPKTIRIIDSFIKNHNRTIKDKHTLKDDYGQ